MAKIYFTLKFDQRKCAGCVDTVTILVDEKRVDTKNLVEQTTQTHADWKAIQLLHMKSARRYFHDSKTADRTYYSNTVMIPTNGLPKMCI